MPVEGVHLTLKYGWHRTCVRSGGGEHQPLRVSGIGCPLLVYAIVDPNGLIGDRAFRARFVIVTTEMQ